MQIPHHLPHPPKKTAKIPYQNPPHIPHPPPQKQIPGKKRYELTNHLGNIMATVTDRKDPVVTATGCGLCDVDYYKAVLVSASDYYPFGTEMVGRKMNTGTYRFGFNGKEKDPQGEWGTQTHYDYGFRIYNPAVGRFLSVDPLTKDYPWYTPYQFAGNTPIQAFDLDGLEPSYTTSPGGVGDKVIASDNTTDVEAEWTATGDSHDPWGIAATEVIVTGKKDGSTLVSSPSKNSPKSVLTLSMNTFTKLGALIDIANRNGNFGNYIYNRYGLDARMQYQKHYLRKRQEQGGKVMLAVVAIPTAPILLVEGGTALGASTRARLFGLNSMRQAGIQFSADFIAQGISNRLQGKSILKDYNFVSGISNALFKNGYVANYIGGQFSVSVKESNVSTFVGAVLNSATSGKSGSSLSGSRLIHKNTIWIKEVGLRTIPNVTGIGYQFLYEDIKKDLIKR